MRVRFSRPALAELNDIFADLAAKSPGAAEHFELRICQISERMARFPHGFQEVAERPGVRRVPLVRYPYVVFYKVFGDEAVVLRVAHGARKEPWENL